MEHSGHFERAVAEAGLILLAEVGSTVQGTNLESGDVDLQGICIESPGVLLGHKSFEQYVVRTYADGSPVPEGRRSEPGGVDRTVFGLRKWAKLATGGNPTALLPLYVPETNLHFVNLLGYEIRGSRDIFLSKRCAISFREYLRRQQLNAFSDAKHTNRPELVQQFGYDTKAAYHAMRLAIQGKELVTEHMITMPMPNGWSDYLKNVRRGEVSRDDALDMLDELVKSLDDAVEHSTLPDNPNIDTIDLRLVKWYTTYWREKSWT